MDEVRRRKVQIENPPARTSPTPLPSIGSVATLAPNEGDDVVAPPAAQVLMDEVRRGKLQIKNRRASSSTAAADHPAPLPPVPPPTRLNGMGVEYIPVDEYMEYGNMVRQTFKSEKEGYIFYLDYAKNKGFGVRKDDLKYKGRKEDAYWRTFVCCKQGYRAMKHFEELDPKRTPRPLSRCGYPARFQIELQRSTGLWFVKNFVDNHNHPFINPELTPFLRSHRSMTDAQKADVIEYSVGGLRTHQIMEVMEKQAGGFCKVGFISRDLYNHVAVEKKKKIQGRDAQFMLNYMAAQKEKDLDFFFRYTTDSKGHLRNIFWADAQSRLDFVAFGGVVVFDSTYRSNKYRLPFVPFVGLNHHRSTIVFGVGLVSDETVASYEWLLEVFLEAMNQKHPISAITDGDASMAKAISSVWPNTYHRLCSWHIEENMVIHLRKEKLKEFRKFIYHAMDVDEFERRWVTYKKKFRITRKKKDVWINRMYELRKKWSAAYTKGRYFLGMQSNQRSESINSRLHVVLNRRMKLVDLVQHYEHCVLVMHNNEAALDAVASHTVPFTKLTAEPLEISASSIYTPVMFTKVKDEIVNLPKWEVAEVLGEGGLIRYGVARKEAAHVRFDVTCVFNGGKLDSANCRCWKMESEDIPCAHIFCVLKYLGLRTIPTCCVKARWTMKAKLAFDSERTANTHVWSEQMNKYHELRNMASAALFTASASTVQSEKVMEYLRSILDEGDMNDGNTRTTSFVPLPAYYSGARQCWTDEVQDPIPIIPKGRPGKESNKRLKPFHKKLKSKKIPLKKGTVKSTQDAKVTRRRERKGPVSPKKSTPKVKPQKRERNEGKKQKGGSSGAGSSLLAPVQLSEDL